MFRTPSKALEFDLLSFSFLIYISPNFLMSIFFVVIGGFFIVFFFVVVFILCFKMESY